MLPKKNRIDRKTVAKIFKIGRFVGSQNLTLKFIKESGGQSRISFVVPKNVARASSKRNYLRRRGYIIIEKYLNRFPLGFYGVFIFKTINIDIENEIKTILTKLH
ncbi:hypothetical protein A2933_00660 [Candidatus Nomurabacteria bacterium RIFCSPLOWO2_01_FULL_46_18]|uniref:Uncharacterized protein n=1 Tax=Candidatus Nomurabacteria bacterium RIFCSPLOWO2_01_FULL_46_18 TaxID=1801783 RepID=A0A1F6XF31_9BACT|nr:MAG: hypothetical protein A2933_00660 [Candidatus Nomurabacteria bacterium RIFCSPLOWO2_01_FULL_46_18]